MDSEQENELEITPNQEFTLSPEDQSLLVQVVEALLFTSQKPVSAKEIRAVCRGAASGSTDPKVTALAKIKDARIESAIAELEESYLTTGRSFAVRVSASGWQLVTRAEFAPWLRQLFPENRSAKLSAPALETLAIIAYRQPITRADIEAVRGVAVDGVMQTLLDRGLVKIAGRAEVPGRPLLYETTSFFMEHFGLRDLEELPNATELRSLNLPRSTPLPSELPAETAESLPAEVESTPAEKTTEPAIDDSENPTKEASPE